MMTEHEGILTDRLARGEAVPGGPGACAREGCAHAKVWHKPDAPKRPCEQCGCAAFLPQPPSAQDAQRAARLAVAQAAAGQPRGASAQPCASPACDRPVRQPPTGRPARYCCPACRQAAHRGRARQAAQAAQRAARLAEATAACAATWRPLEEASETAAETAAAVVCYAAEGERADLVAKLTELHTTVARLGELALAYHDAAAEAGRLSAAAP